MSQTLDGFLSRGAAPLTEERAAPEARQGEPRQSEARQGEARQGDRGSEPQGREAAEGKQPAKAPEGKQPEAKQAQGKPPQAKPPEGKGARTAEPEAEEEPHDDGNGMIPKGAYLKARNDWKDRAARAETKAEQSARELADLRRQLDEATRRATPAPQQTAPRPVPDPNVDPQGYAAHIQSVVINERLNGSEARLRDKLGDEAVDKLTAEFQKMAEADPSLGPKLYAQRDPYAWAHKQVEQHRLLHEIGDDPAAYQARLREQWEAEREAEAQEQAAQQPQRISPAAGMAPSLANARSAAPRASGGFTGPPSLGDIVGRHTTR